MDYVFNLENIDFAYSLGNQEIRALRDVSLSLPSGQLISISGPSGSGKSTLLSLLGLIEPVQSGTLCFLGKNVQSLKEAERNRLRSHELGFVFQQFLLFDQLTAIENVEYFLKNIGISGAERRDRAREALDIVGLEKLHDHKPLQLSGGQRQRVAIARALAKRPKVIIADEPTASLDQGTGEAIMQVFSGLVSRGLTTLVFSSHDPMALTYADHDITLRDGRVGHG